MSTGARTAKSKTITRSVETAKPVRPSTAHQNQSGPVVAKKSNATQTLPQTKLQAKLTMGRVGDAHEQQADAMAEKVVRTTDAEIKSTAKKGSAPALQQMLQNQVNRKVLPKLDASIQAKANEEKLQKKGNDEKELKKKGSDEKLMKKGNDEKELKKKGNDEKLMKKGNDEKEVKKKGNDEKLMKKGNDEKELQKKANDEKLMKKGNDEKELKKKGNDEKLMKKVDKELPKAQLKPIQLKPIVAPKLVALKEEKKLDKKGNDEKKEQAVQKKVLLKEQAPVAAIAPKIISLKEEKKLDKKGNDEKVEKPIQKKIQAKENSSALALHTPHSAFAIAPKIISLKEEKKLDKKGNDEKKEQAVQKKVMLKEQSAVTVIAPKIISLKEEKKLDKKGNDEKVEKPIQKKIQAKENSSALALQTSHSVVAIAPKIISLKEEKKLDKKGNDDKKEQAVQKKVMLKEQAAVVAIAPKIISLKEEKKLDKKGNDEKVEKPIQKKIQAKENSSALALQTSHSVVAIAPKIISLKEEKKLDKKGNDEKKEQAVQKKIMPKEQAPVAAIAPKIISLKEEKKLDKKGNDEKEQQVQREAKAAPQEPNTVTPEFESRLNAAANGGVPLATDVREWMEARFQVGFSQVRIHTDATAIRLCNEIGAQAFAFGANIFFNAGKYNPTSTTGRFLLAHELTHVIQQGFSDEAMAEGEQAEDKKPQLKTCDTCATTPTTVAPKSIQAAAEEKKETKKPEGITPAPRSVQRGAIDSIRSGLAALAANIPGYSLLCVLIAYNPILGQSVDRSFTNILRGFMGLIPGGEILFQVLSRYGVIDQMGNWVSQQADAMGVNSGMITNAFNRFVDTLSGWDIFSPGDVWERAKAVFTDPINRIINFVSSIITQAIAWLKEKFLQPIAEFAGQIPGFKLFKLIIGRDPFTNVAAPTTPIAVIEAVAEFIPGGDEKVKELKESKGLQKAYDWFMTETKSRNLTWERISGTVGQIWDSLKLEDILSPIETIQRVGKIAQPLMTDLLGFAGACLMKLLEIIYEAVMGAGGALVLGIIKKSQATFKTIIRNPVGFLGNLITAVGMGIRQFSGNILKHLQAGVVTWLTGTLTKAGIELPKEWDLKGVLKLIMTVLGITWPRIRGIAVEVFTAPVVDTIEKVAGLVMDIKEKGFVQTMKDRINEFFSGLKEMVLGKIKTFIQEKIVMAGITQLVSMLSPVGAVIQAIIKTYQTVMFFVQKITQILEFVNSVVDSIASIANGSLGAAASYIEATMARTIPLILDFLARMIGLGDISGKIKSAMEAAQNFIAGKIRQGMVWVKTQVMRLMTSLVQAGVPQDPKERLKLGMKASLAVVNRFRGKFVGKLILTPLLNVIKTRYGLTELIVYDKNEKWWIKAKINPEDDKASDAKFLSKANVEKTVEPIEVISKKVNKSFQQPVFSQFPANANYPNLKVEFDGLESKFMKNKNDALYNEGVTQFLAYQEITTVLSQQYQSYQVKFDKREKFLNRVKGATHIAPVDYSGAKHWKGRNQQERIASSLGNKPGQFRWGMTAAEVKTLEIDTLVTGDPAHDIAASTVHVYKAQSNIGYANGLPASTHRAEISGNTVHSHPR